jgi:hypothetical protein
MPALESNGQALLLALCSTCNSTQQDRVSGLQSANAGSSLSRLTEITLPNIVASPASTLSTGAAWMCLRNRNDTGNYADLIFQLPHNSTAWHQEASIPI